MTFSRATRTNIICAAILVSLIAVPAQAKFKKNKHYRSAQVEHNACIVVDDRYPCVIGGPSASAIASGQSSLYGAVSAAASRAGVPQHIAHAVVKLESNYQLGLRGRAGEYGLGQIKCQTARGVGFSGDCSQLADPVTNLNYSMIYLRQALAKGGNNCLGVSLYNSGVGAAPHCSAYGRKVMAMAGQ
jgi:soluble lytic murein transglycosylase-like protein